MPTIVLDVDGPYSTDLVGVAPGRYRIQLWAAGGRGGQDAGASAGSGGSGGNYVEGTFDVTGTTNFQINVLDGTGGLDNDVFASTGAGSPTTLSVVAETSNDGSGGSGGAHDAGAFVSGTWLVAGTDIVRFGGDGAARSGSTPGGGGSGGCPSAAGNNASGTTGGSSSGATSGAGGNGGSHGSDYGGGGGGENVGETVRRNGGKGHLTITYYGYTADVDVTAPVPSLDFSGTASSDVSGSVDLTAPAPSLDASGTFTPAEATGEVSFTAPAPSLSFDGTFTPAEATSDVAFTAPAPLLDFSGTFTPADVEATVDVTAPAPSLAYSGDAPSDAVEGDVDFTAPAPSLDFSGLTFDGDYRSGFVDFTSPAPSLSATADSGTPLLLQSLANGMLLVVDGLFAMARGMFGAGENKLLANECCCEACDCNAESASPTADFDYEQTSAEPCTFDFTDTSTPGTCGEIVYWAWYRDAELVPFSTEQNPHDIVFPGVGPWDVTLLVRDSAGCEDAAVQEIECAELLKCSDCTDLIPEFVTVTSSGWTNDDCGGGFCTDLNGSLVIPVDPGSTGTPTCSFVLHTGRACFGGQFQVVVTIKAGGKLRVAIGTGGFDFVNFDKTLAAGPCLGTHTLNAATFFGDGCHHPATITLVI